MTPKPPPSPDGSSLPPRHRPNLGNLAKDTTEMDLWAFDDLEPLEEIQDEPPAAVPKPGIPAPRDTTAGAGQNPGMSSPSHPPGIPPTSHSGDSISVNINKRAKKARSSKMTRDQAIFSSHSTPGRDFEDLDPWEVKTPQPAVPESIPEIQSPVIPEVPEVDKFVEIAAAESNSAPEPADDREEFSPKVREQSVPVSLRPKLNLTKIERIGLASLLAVILLGAGTFYLYTINRLPKGDERAEKTDFPIKGSDVTVETAVTYWRVPITAGDKPDTVRRDTLLIPVVDLSTNSGAAAIRVFFRDSNGELIGDPVTRAIHGHNKIEIAATAGFDDLGEHAAYRTKQTKPWSIELLEAPSEDLPANRFKKLFEMNISTDRR